MYFWKLFKLKLKKRKFIKMSGILEQLCLQYDKPLHLTVDVSPGDKRFILTKEDKFNYKGVTLQNVIVLTTPLKFKDYLVKPHLQQLESLDDFEMYYIIIEEFIKKIKPLLSHREKQLNNELEKYRLFMDLKY